MPSRFVILTALVLTVVLSLPADAAWVDLGRPDSVRPLVTTSGGGDLITLEIDVAGFDLSSVEIEGSSYSRVTLPGHQQMMERGYPELPFISTSLMIAGTGSPLLRVVDTEWIEIAADPVAPSKGHFSRDIDPGMVSYEFADFYAQGGVWPTTTVESADPFIVRDVRGVNLQLHPVRYDADRGVLMVLTRVVVEVETKGVGVNEKLSTTRTVDAQFDRIYRGLFANYGADKYVPVNHPGRMLVVTDDALQGAMTDFVAWKRQKGLTVEVITTSSVGGTLAGVQNAITTRYNEPEGLTFVILVGDVAQIPSPTGTAEGNHSDALYAMVDGSDLYTDLFISRISASNPTEVQIQTNKFIRYERDPDTGTSAAWYHKASGLASNEGSPSDAERADWVRTDLLGYNFTDVDQIYQPSGTTAQITAALDNGRSLLYYIGHGSGTSWSNPPYSNSTIPNLNNGWMQPWIIDVSCSNGTMTLEPCMAETWMRLGTTAQPEGAVAIFSSWGTCAWVPPTVMMDEAVDLFVAETTNTIGALYYFGAMKVLDGYPGTNGEGQKFVEQYSIFGDCSMIVRSDVPTAIAAVHPPVVPLNAPTFDVSVPGEAGLTAAVYSGGVLYGSAVTDGTGAATIVFDTPVTTPGDVTLTVTGFNKVPYIQTLSAINPSTVVLSPTAIDANVTTDVTVTVYGSDGVTPVPDVSVWAEGLDYTSPAGTTDVNGQVVLSLTYSYGPSLDVVGQESGAAYELFRELLGVNALALTSPDLTVSTAFGMVDQFGLNLEGILNASVGEPGATLHAVMPDGATSSIVGTSLAATPAQLGLVTGLIALSGYDLYSEDFDVITAFGTVGGHVDAAGGPAVGAVVRFLDGAAAEVFTAVTNASGDYTVTVDQVVAPYTVVVDFFGFLHYENSFFLGYGANTFDIGLAAASAGDLSGTVTELGTGAPLAATVKALRSDNGSLVAQIATDPLDGSYTLSLSYFTYDVQVVSVGHVPSTVAVTVDAPTVAKDFVLDVTNGNILVINDGRSDGVAADKVNPKDQSLLAQGYMAAADRSAATMAADLTAMGYSVTNEAMDTTDPGTWSTYDLLVVSSGANTSSLSNAAFRAALVSYCQGGGHLLLEGGEVAYSWNSDTSIKNSVMHVSAWNGDSSGSVTVGDAGHPVMSTPNTVVGPISVGYSGYGDQDRVTATADAVMPGRWSSYSTYGSVVTFDDNALPQAGQIVFFTFNYDVMEATARVGLLENAAAWLLGVEIGSCSVSGNVSQLGGSPAAGALVTLLPGGESTTTDAGGDYGFVGVFPGSYTVQAGMADWSTEQVPVTLVADQSLTGVDFTLLPVIVDTFCDQTAIMIPDGDLTGIDVTIPVAGSLSQTISSVELYLDITHPFIGDLVIDLIAPDGTTVAIHHNTGAGADNILGWYPSEITPSSPLTALVGTQVAGPWTLHLHDVGNFDFGPLNEWCLKLTYTATVTGTGEQAPSAFTLERNYPNPFNPSTTIRFSLPREGRADLKVYDLAGRLVRTLVDEVLPATTHSVEWQGRDDRGRVVPSGTYYYRLSTDSGMAVRRMTLLK